MADYLRQSEKEGNLMCERVTSATVRYYGMRIMHIRICTPFILLNESVIDNTEFNFFEARFTKIQHSNIFQRATC